MPRCGRADCGKLEDDVVHDGIMVCENGRRCKGDCGTIWCHKFMPAGPGDRLTTFLYVLLRDHVPAGVVAGILAEHVEKFEGAPVFSNPHLAAYAAEIAAALQRGQA